MDPKLRALLNDAFPAEEYERRMRELTGPQWKDFRRLAGRPTNEILEEQKRRDRIDAISDQRAAIPWQATWWGALILMVIGGLIVGFLLWAFGWTG